MDFRKFMGQKWGRNFHIFDIPMQYGKTKNSVFTLFFLLLTYLYIFD